MYSVSYTIGHIHDPPDKQPVRNTTGHILLRQIHNPPSDQPPVTLQVSGSFYAPPEERASQLLSEKNGDSLTEIK